MTGLGGSWKKLANGTRQYITEDGGILNWHESKGKVWFQGDDEAAEKLEQKFKKAARGQIASTPTRLRKSSAGKVVKSDSRKSLRRLSKKLARFEEKLDGQFADLDKRYRVIEEVFKCLGRLLFHSKLLDSVDSEVDDDQYDDGEKRSKPVKPRLRLIAKSQGQVGGRADGKAAAIGKDKSVSEVASPSVAPK
jgi:hypothetical protein